MGFAVSKTSLLLLQFSLLFFTVFSDEEIETTVAPAHPPAAHHHHNHHAHPPSSTITPSLPPSHHHHHHHHPHNHHAPAPAPTHVPAHVPVHPPTPPSHPPVHPPSHIPAPPTPAHPPVKPPVKPPPKYPFPRRFVAVQGVVYCKSCNYSGVDTLLGAKPVEGATVKLQCNNTKYPLESKKTTDKNGYFYLEASKKITTYGAHKCKAFLVSAPTTACSKITDLHGGLTGGALRPVKKFEVKKLPFVMFNVGPFAFESKCPR